MAGRIAVAKLEETSKPCRKKRKKQLRVEWKEIRAGSGEGGVIPVYSKSAQSVRDIHDPVYSYDRKGKGESILVEARGGVGGVLPLLDHQLPETRPL